MIVASWFYMQSSLGFSLPLQESKIRKYSTKIEQKRGQAISLNFQRANGVKCNLKITRVMYVSGR